jgi:rhodanese-like protein
MDNRLILYEDVAMSRTPFDFRLSANSGGFPGHSTVATGSESSNRLWINEFRQPAYSALRLLVCDGLDTPVSMGDPMTLKRRTLLLLLAALPAGAQAPENEADVPRITVAELEKARSAGRVLLIDVRGNPAYQEGHIAGAVSIPESALPRHVESFKAEKRIIVTYCA